MMNEKILKMLDNRTDFYPLQLAKQFPQIFDKVMIMWDSPEFDSYLNKFMLDHREHPRQGFPPEVATEFLRLSKLHSELFGSAPISKWIEPSNIKLD